MFAQNCYLIHSGTHYVSFDHISLSQGKSKIIFHLQTETLNNCDINFSNELQRIKKVTLTTHELTNTKLAELLLPLLSLPRVLGC